VGEQVVDQSVGLVGDNLAVVDCLQADSPARSILGADVERQIAGLAASGDELLRIVEVAFAQAVRLKQVAVVTAADAEIE
jgi:hypothetical protein